jgi:uncharacterized protein YjgD (DUF1641 family)
MCWPSAEFDPGGGFTKSALALLGLALALLSFRELRALVLLDYEVRLIEGERKRRSVGLFDLLDWLTERDVNDDRCRAVRR